MAKFKPGQSGNPSGRPRANIHLKKLAQENTEEAIKTLVAVMKNKKAAAAARVSAATALLDRGYGKPTQAIDYSSNINIPQLESLTEVIRIVQFAAASEQARIINQELEDIAHGN